MVHAIPHLKKQKELSPSIVNVSSVNGKQAFASCVAYCMSKAAVDQLTRCASVDLAKDGIRVNAVNPGVIETNIHKV
jgi:NAD(P)-dependent dehydrogenase (short-subunit alcohol dehydrogenase family)